MPEVCTTQFLEELYNRNVEPIRRGHGGSHHLMLRRQFFTEDGTLVTRQCPFNLSNERKIGHRHAKVVLDELEFTPQERREILENLYRVSGCKPEYCVIIQ